MWVSASQKIPLFWRETHTKGQISHETGRGKEGPRVKRRDQVSRQKEAEQKSGEADGRERGLLEPVDSDAGLANVRG